MRLFSCKLYMHAKAVPAVHSAAAAEALFELLVIIMIVATTAIRATQNEVVRSMQLVPTLSLLQRRRGQVKQVAVPVHSHSTAGQEGFLCKRTSRVS
mmetsp:Transcript_31868/g.62740  ORF Transcript_31868/g.62740 Transcript_31868/m.62740 type:complete len:97 (+) Transcript_31868:50-340(+)